MKKLLNTLYVTDETAYLSLDGENIVIKMSEGRTARFPLVNLENIVCFSYLGCSPALMGKCCEDGVGICFVSPEGRFLARVQGRSRGNVLLRTAQIKRFMEYQPGLVRNTVAAKLANSRFTVNRSLRDRPEIDNDGAVSALLGKLERSVDEVYSLEEKKRTDIIHPFLKQKIKLGLLPFVQSNLLAKFVRGELAEYPAYIQK